MTERKELVFVCLAERQRSPTGRDLFNMLFRRDKLEREYHASSAGLVDETPLNQEKVDSAYKIIAVDGMVANGLAKTFLNIREKMIQLAIRDIYDKDAPELIGIFTKFYESGEWR